MDYSKVTENDKVVALLIQRRRIEKQIMKLDVMALINYELEKLAEPQANEPKTRNESARTCSTCYYLPKKHDKYCDTCNGTNKYKQV